MLLANGEREGHVCSEIDLFGELIQRHVATDETETTTGVNKLDLFNWQIMEQILFFPG